MIESPKQVPPGVTCIALPFVSKQGFDGATVSSLIFGLIFNKMQKCMFDFYADYPTSHARNAAVERVLRVGAEWLWFIDSDADFPINTLERLKALDADIACTDMWSRQWPSFRTVMEYDKGKGWPKKKSLKSVADGEKISGQRDIDSCGMHCTLIKASLLRKFAKHRIVPFPLTNSGEDANFCAVAKHKFKATLRCDFDIVAGHWGRCRQAGQDFTRDARNQHGSVADPDMLRRMGVKNMDEVQTERKMS